MRTRQFHLRWVLALLMVVLWARELHAPPGQAIKTVAAVIPLPPYPSLNAQPAATLPAAELVVALETCFEREPDDYWAVRQAVLDDYALYGEFAMGVTGTPVILALYESHDGKIWGYAERCNSAAYHQQAKAVKKLRTASLTKDFPDWRQGSSFGGGKPYRGVGPSSFGYVPFGGLPSVFSFGGGGGGGKGTSDGGSGGGDNSGNHLVGGNGSGGDGDNPDDKDNTGPDNGNPTNPDGTVSGTDDPTAVPEPGTLAVFLGLLAGLGVMRRRALN